MKRLILIAALALACVAPAACMPPVNRSNATPLTVAPIEPARYLGLWYEIARFPNEFETGCAGVTAEYTPRPDGKLTVVNTCRRGGKTHYAKGVVRIVDKRTNAKMKVRFFGPFEGDYWVIDRAADYSWSLVGEPHGRYLWMLARTPSLSEPVKADLVHRLRTHGYNTGALTWTVH